MKLALAILLTACLTACQGNQVSTGTQQIEQGCTAASAAIKVLTVANDKGKLSAAQQRATLTAIGLIDPVCASPTPPTLDTVKQQAFLQAIAALESNAKGVKP
jgi:hypothetical protein